MFCKKQRENKIVCATVVRENVSINMFFFKNSLGCKKCKPKEEKRLKLMLSAVTMLRLTKRK